MAASFGHDSTRTVTRRARGAYVSAIVWYWAISSGEPTTPKVSLCGGSGVGDDESDVGDVGDVGELLAPVCPDDVEDSHAARRAVVRTAAASRAVDSRVPLALDRTAEP